MSDDLAVGIASMLETIDTTIRRIAGRDDPAVADYLLHTAALLDATADAQATTQVTLYTALGIPLVEALRERASRARALAPIFARPMSWPITIMPETKP